MLAFAHIEKCAGTTFKSILKRNFGVAFCDVRPLVSPAQKGFDKNTAEIYNSIVADGANPNLFGPADLKLYQRLIPWLKCFAGHSVRPCLGLANDSPHIQFVTILREPLSRYVSHYSYGERASARHPWPFSFEDYLKKPRFQNFQTKKIAGISDLDSAIRILENSFTLVGTMDGFDEFLVLLKTKLAYPEFDIRYRKLNIQNKSGGRPLLTQYAEEINRNNKLDLELYRYAAETLMPRYQKEFGGSLERAVTDFQRQNLTTKPINSSREIHQKLAQRLYYDNIAGILRKRAGLRWGGPY